MYNSSFPTKGNIYIYIYYVVSVDISSKSIWKETFVELSAGCRQTFKGYKFTFIYALISVIYGFLLCFLNGGHFTEGTNKELHDYISKSHIQVLFPGGLTTAKFDVRMVDNMIIENTERFKVYIDPLSLPYGVVTVEPTSADVNIVDDDGKQCMCISILWIVIFSLF